MLFKHCQYCSRALITATACWLRTTLTLTKVEPKQTSLASRLQHWSHCS